MRTLAGPCSQSTFRISNSRPVGAGKSINEASPNPSQDVKPNSLGIRLDRWNDVNPKNWVSTQILRVYARTRDLSSMRAAGGRAVGRAKFADLFAVAIKLDDAMIG